jgi:hypothetical protein
VPRDAASSSRDAASSSRASVFEIAVATNSVKAAILDSISTGSGRSCFEETIITPQRRWSTTIGAPTDERRPSSRPNAAAGPDAFS